MDEPNRQRVLGDFSRIIGIAIITTICVAAAVASLVYATEIFLVLFLAVLFGVFLSRVSNFLTDKTSLAYGWSLGIVTTTMITLLVASVLLFGVQVDDQIADARAHVDEAETLVNDLATKHPSLRSIIASTPFLHAVLENPPATKGLNTNIPDGFIFGSSNKQNDKTKVQRSTVDRSQEPDPRFDRYKATVSQDAIKASTARAASVLGGVFKTTFGLLVNSVLIFFVGLFIAVAPDSYRDGIVSLFPPDRRERTTEVMNMMGDSMWSWLIGRFGSMLITGVGAATLLEVLGVPMAISIGFITALLAFIPNIGGIIALMLAVLFALPQGGTTVGLVVGGYTLLQLVESYIATPLIQQKQVSIPPALLISFQAVLGVLFGFLGAAVASPMLAAAKVGVEEAYIKDVLESDASTNTADTDSDLHGSLQFDQREQPFSNEEQEPTLMA